MFEEQYSETRREFDLGCLVRGCERRFERAAQRVPVVPLAIDALERIDRIRMGGVQFEGTSPIGFGALRFGEIFFLQACELA